MYYPVQIPYILNKEFSEAVRYTEETDPRFKDFTVCFWEMQPHSDDEKTVENIIITDACIDLVADYDGKRIGFTGMSRTEFHFEISLPSQPFGVRFKPGAFHAITGISATDAMDVFLPIDAVYEDFDVDYFFSLPINEAKNFFKNYVGGLIRDKEQTKFLSLFDKLSTDIPATAAELYKRLNYSPKQCQRLFNKHYGLSPQMVLCILRFQKCLEILTSGKASPGDALNTVNYYDQSHFIKDFKRNIGITPVELLKKYR
jgi:AraC-like DNA-binding protein